MTTLQETITALRALSAKATPAYWDVREAPDGMAHVAIAGSVRRVALCDGIGTDAQRKTDAALIVSMRNNIDTLLSAAEASEQFVPAISRMAREMDLLALLKKGAEAEMQYQTALSNRWIAAAESLLEFVQHKKDCRKNDAPHCYTHGATCRGGEPNCDFANFETRECDCGLVAAIAKKDQP